MAGRAKKSSVWNYFKHSKENNTSTCVVVVNASNGDEEDVICGKEIRGMYASNLKKHLKSHHKEKYQEFEREEIGRISSRSALTQGQDALVQQTMESSFKVPTSYSQDSKKHLDITKKLAVFVGSTNVPLSLVDCDEFRDLLSEMDKRYDIPHRWKLGQEINKVYDGLRLNISCHLEHAKKVSICCDVWSKQGMTASFLGITAHFFTHLDKKRHNITLACRRFPSPHTGDKIAVLLEAIIDDWKIPREKVFRSLTDNGSNMIRAFNLLQQESSHRNDSDSESDNETEDVNEIEDDNETEDATDEETQGDEAVVTDINNFEQCERDHDFALIRWKRISCFAHTLQLVVKEFEKAPCFKSTLKTALRIIKKVNRSCKTTERLIMLAGKKLIGDCPTRWDSTFLMLSRMNSVKSHLDTVLEELSWDGLTVSQWKQLRAIEELLQPFAHYTSIGSSEKSTSIAMVMPILKELELHLNEVIISNGSSSGIHKVASKMKKALTTRFKFVFEPSAINFDAIYVASTLLNPGYRGLVSTDQLTHAKKFLMELMPPVSESEEGDSIGGLQESAGNDASLSEPAPKRYKHLSRVSDLLQMQEEEEEVVEIAKEELDIENYLKSKISKEDKQLDPIQYWVNRADSYPTLSPIACDILTIPASTAPVERMFSVSGEATRGKRNRLDDYNLERETLLRKNKSYII